jgi:crotonobetaine/carnitine-CoA ligase
VPRSIDRLLAARAREKPSACFLRFPDQDLTFDEVDRRSTNLAAGLAALGVRRGDLVPIFMPNRPEFVLSWFAVCKLGAVATLMNTAMRGPALVHAINLGGAEIAIVDQSLLDSIDSVTEKLVHLRLLVVTDDMAAKGTVRDLVTLRLSAVESSGIDGTAIPPVTTEHDPAMVIFTSGTTGPAKGCVLSHRYAVRQAELMIEHLALRDDDVLYCPFPLFHLDASILTVMPALVLGATAAIGTRFSLSSFWQNVRAFGATVFDFMGATLTMLHKVPAVPEDIDNPVRLAWGVPVPGFAAEFEARFGLKLAELYGSTDAGVPIYHPIDEPRRAGSCGRAIPSYEVRLFDEGGMPVPTGDIGEIVIRPNEPSLMSMGYYGMPEATVAANRDLWFHTSDLARQDEDGYFYFVGRSSESIRRRGENISAFEVEEVIKLHPQVMDAAAYGVPSELSEDDVMIAVVPRPGQNIDPAELIEFCRERMARHMLPRYVDLISELPRTPTEKVEKRFLIDRGVTASTWDRESRA